jgi:hypothetical protein
VVDERGFPVAGARVEVPGGALGARIATCDRSGCFRLDGLGPGPYQVRVSHPDFAPVEIAELAPADDAQLQLMPGAGLSGQVSDARSGQVPSGVALELIVDGRSRPLPLSRGRFEATGLRAGTVTLRASAPGYVGLSRVLELPPGDRPREVTLRDVAVELERGGTVSGVVIDDDGAPVVSVPVSCGTAHGRTDGRGEFRLDGVAPGALRVEVRRGDLHADAEVEVRADDETRVELRLR